ncbi:MAG: hypothetical protein N4A76_14460 [Firmicutes bacterium]|jgi:hypothetical protein|nr:hypothetical protein [Bacillota bacterium]
MDKKVVQFNEKKKEINDKKRRLEKEKEKNQKRAYKARSSKGSSSVFIKGMIAILAVSLILTLVRFL